ncbi:MAG TPA: type IV pilus biogenesis/stability protein PilW [Ramlibacter sp.]|nr:type IV pilus biogenesis/stability protein PilW [Ramlibacter sp.]
MTMTRTARAVAAVQLLAACAGIGAVFALAGCASQTAASPEIVTQSDETEARKRARIRLELAIGYFEQGKTDIALDELKQSISIDPSFAEAYNLRGLIFMRMNDNRAAEDSFRRAASVNPRDADTQHNLGWLLCQQGRYDESQRAFQVALANPLYAGRAKTLMAEGVCYTRAGKYEEAERSLARAYELDPGNPVTSYNFANLLYRRGENTRAQFVIRQLNNSELANAESLWLGIKVERRLNDGMAMRQLGEQLRKRFATSREAKSFERGAYDE